MSYLIFLTDFSKILFKNKARKLFITVQTVHETVLLISAVQSALGWACSEQKRGKMTNKAQDKNSIKTDLSRNEVY